MNGPAALLPGQPVPTLSLDLVEAGSGRSKWALGEDWCERFWLLNFYRGLHCPKCRDLLASLESLRDGYRDAGAELVSISMDDQERAERTAAEWNIPDYGIAYGLTAAKAREWGLFLSSGRGKTSVGIEETKVFNEPGLFLVRAPDGKDPVLHGSWVQSMPFLRPDARAVLEMLGAIEKMGYPPRGTLEV